MSSSLIRDEDKNLGIHTECAVEQHYILQSQSQGKLLLTANIS